MRNLGGSESWYSMLEKELIMIGEGIDYDWTIVDGGLMAYLFEICQFRKYMLALSTWQIRHCFIWSLDYGFIWKFGLCLHMVCLHMDPCLCWYTSTCLNNWILANIFPYQLWVSDLGMICMICIRMKYVKEFWLICMICIRMKYVKGFWSWFSISLFNIMRSTSFKMNWSIQ